ncbi:MAG: hypothetical protein IJC46_09085 [Clostridia bacterium]|nr:hypothetical protein [Clostridia bacterium]
MNCPHCNAKIEENARFCVFCMTSLEEKEVVAPLKLRAKRWWPLAVAALMALLLGLGVWLLWPQKAKEEPALPETPMAEQQEETPREEAPTEEAPPAEAPTEEAPTEEVPPAEAPTVEAPTVQPQQMPSGSETQSPAKEEQKQPEQSQGEGEPSTPQEQPPAETPKQEEPSTGTEAEYLYRDAKYGDDYHVNAYIEDAVVIIGIKTPAADGIYRLPSELGGKRVIAVMGLTFFNSGQQLSVKKVVVPASVRTIWDHAFAGCANLTDIYFCGESIYVSSWAFPELEKRSGTLTIHCSETCNNRDLRYYKNIASSYYEAVFKEWDGGAL